MRKYTETVVNVNEIEKVLCNGCGKEMQVRNGIVEEGIMSVDVQWNYFSDKDGETHSFDLCEECYDRIIKSFKIPPVIKEQNELI